MVTELYENEIQSIIKSCMWFFFPNIYATLNLSYLHKYLIRIRYSIKINIHMWYTNWIVTKKVHYIKYGKKNNAMHQKKYGFITVIFMLERACKLWQIILKRYNAIQKKKKIWIHTKYANM